jgi:hypothetical protein
LKRPNSSYYDDLKHRMDIVLSFAEQRASICRVLFSSVADIAPSIIDASDDPFPLNMLEDLFEVQTVASCAHLFSWIESRGERLCVDMEPSKGRALVLLRMLNELLRRVSRSGRAATLSGRILTFVAGVFPLSERSGVNLRGEYGPPWKEVHVEREEVVKAEQKAQEPNEEKMDVDAGLDFAEKKAQEKAGRSVSPR